VLSAPSILTALLVTSVDLTKLVETVMTTTTSTEHLFLASSLPVCLCFLPLFSDFKGTAN
jgi:hypothetical protein